jgi:sterol desaturase/sphingolipid hydroxylase (fatty acid hydroxylase superfamily)
MEELVKQFATALVLPLVFVVVERLTTARGRPWLTPHFLTDGCLGLVRVLALGGFFAAYAGALNLFYTRQLAFLNTRLLEGVPAWLQFVLYYLAFDFAYYWFHRLTHSHKVFWVFHAVHHSQRQANAMMQNRSHPIEELLFIAWRPLPLVILGGDYPVVFWYLLLEAQWSYFVHSDIKTNLGPLKYLVVTPQFHRIHHSIETQHFDKNFGGRLIVWDWLFGTMWPDFDVYPEIGMTDYPVEERSTAPWKVAGYVVSHLAYPFATLWAHYRPARSRTRDPEPSHASEMANVGP